MDITAVESRISQIQAGIAALQAGAVTDGAATAPTSRVSNASKVQFAGALESAMAPATSAAGWTAPAQGKLTSGYGPR